jgi:hypothetical protein
MFEDDALASRTDRLAAKDKFSGVLLVRRDGRDLFARAFGHADANGVVPNTLDTKFFSPASTASAGPRVSTLACREAEALSSRPLAID